MKKIALFIICIVFSASMISCEKKAEIPVSSKEFPKWVQFYSYEGLEEYIVSVNPNTTSYKYDSERSTYNIYGEI